MIRQAQALQDAHLAATAKLLNGGVIRIYAGTMPDSPDSEATGTLLAELVFSSPAFGRIVGGVMEANPTDPDTSARAGGRAEWARLLMADGTTAVLDGDVGPPGSGAFVEINSVAVQVNALVSLASLTLSAGT